MVLSRLKIYDKRDDFDFDIVNFPFLDGDVPRSTSLSQRAVKPKTTNQPTFDILWCYGVVGWCDGAG